MKKLLITFALLALNVSAFANYNFIFFYKENNAQTKNMQEVFQNAMNQATDRAKGKMLQVNEMEAKKLIQKYSLQHAPMPFVLVLAPNGALMGGFPYSFDEEQLLGSFSTPVVENCLLALQNHRLVVLCMQNTTTASNNEAMQGVKDFKADPRYKGATEIIMVDPNDQQNQNFLAQLGINVNTKEATTALLAPPADVVGTFTGKTTKAELTQSLTKASSGCCPGGCCPGGCCPGGKCCP